MNLFTCRGLLLYRSFDLGYRVGYHEALDPSLSLFVLKTISSKLQGVPVITYPGIAGVLETAMSGIYNAY